MDYALAAIALSIVSVVFLLMVPIGAVLSANAYRANEATARLTAILTQVFSEIRLIKAHSSESVESDRCAVEIGNLRRINLRSAKVFASLNPFISLTVCAAVVAIFFYGGVRVQQGSLSIGTLTAFILYIFTVIAPLLQLTNFATQLQVARGASVRVLAILSSSGEDRARPSSCAPHAIPTRAALTFERVVFSYTERNRPTLVIPKLNIPFGSSTALVGPSGSGKSTLFALIECFYPVDSGAICYDGQDIQSFPVDAWRLKIGYVAQTTPMIVGSIRDNITYGLEHPVSDAEIWAAADAANSTDFIRALPEGLDSQIGERGVRLSGGQKQRIAIARLFVRDPEILLLDEATSNLDRESEHAVISAVQRLKSGRTNIVATHRLNTISSVDQIVVLQEGHVTAIGNHRELSMDSGYYGRLSSRQNAL
jgi:ATP-binding cassette subfamily B protein AbcA/BmrA